MNEILDFIKSITETELNYIAAADYGRDIDKHRNALKDLIFVQNGIVQKGQYWYPYEVVELNRWSCKEGHEREFAICHLIIALSIIAEADISNSASQMLENLQREYHKLPKDLYELVVNAMSQASHTESQ